MTHVSLSGFTESTLSLRACLFRWFRGLALLAVCVSFSHAAQIALQWDDKSNNETGFEIERASSASGSFVRLTSVGANTTTYTDAAVTSGAKYVYRVRAYNASGASTYTNLLETTAPTDPVSPTPTPTPTPDPTPPPTTTPTPARQTITFGTLSSKTYGAAGFTLNATASSGLPVAYSSSNESVATITGNTVTIVGAGSTSITASQAGNTTYAAAPSVSQTLTVAKASLTMTAVSKTRTYGSTVGLTWTTTGYVNGESGSTSGVTGAPALSTTTSRNSPVGTYPISISSGTLAAANYTFNLVPGTLTINKAPLTVTADSKTKTVGTDNPPLTATIAGFQNGESLSTSGVTGLAALTTTATRSSPVGTYPISVTVGSLSASNYSFGTFVNGTLTIQSKPKKSRLTNLSVRSAASAGDESLIVGFATSGTTDNSLLVRGVGPSLTDYGVTNALPDPSISVYTGTTALTQNDNWASSADADSVAAATTAAGGFPLARSSKDSAVLTRVPQGSYSAQITSKSNEAGIVLAEIYTVANGSDSHLVNVSARAKVGTGPNVLIAGFVVEGDEPRQYLIRAVGPALAGFGVARPLADPKLSIFPQGATSAMATNDNWGGTAELNAAFASVGAFELSSDSKDSAILVTLEPGAYTAVVSGATDTTGVAIVEVYEMQ